MILLLSYSTFGARQLALFLPQKFDKMLPPGDLYFDNLRLLTFHSSNYKGKCLEYRLLADGGWTVIPPQQNTTHIATQKALYVVLIGGLHFLSKRLRKAFAVSTSVPVGGLWLVVPPRIDAKSRPIDCSA